MTKDLIFEKLQAIIADEADMEKEEITADSRLVNDIGLTSVEILNATAEIEKTFSVRISEKMLRAFVIVQDIVNCIDNLLEGK